MEKDLELKLLVVEIRLLARRLSESMDSNILESLGVDLAACDIPTLRQIRGHLRDSCRSLGGSRGQ